MARTPRSARWSVSNVLESSDDDSAPDPDASTVAEDGLMARLDDLLAEEARKLKQLQDLRATREANEPVSRHPLAAVPIVRSGRV